MTGIAQPRLARAPGTGAVWSGRNEAGRVAVERAATRRHVLKGAAAGALAAAWPARSATPGLHEVEISGFAYIPAELAVRPGDRVRWTNRDRAPHTATGMSRGWDTGQLGQGRSAEVTVTADMDPEYFCAIHPQMRARLVIAGV